MYLFKMEVVLDIGNVVVIVSAKDDESAFSLAEIEIEQHYLKLPDIKELSIVEKKPVRKGTGFVI
ncbi:DUF3906 family protein [Alkalihalobacterium bogoriense]|uniref:DUF3906 family protein n=1 Tax=Alkalihalobacterium bogoriense TaxID=246272 RepID=UPI000478AF3E|nr:DUF3906 family protein [Alkalihalobacterium bogoriense]